MDNRPIGFFDSGIGGLTVLYEAINSMPKENYIYYADTNHVPYGLKTNEQIEKYVTEAINFLIYKDVKAIVIACNTATSITIETLRKKYSIPIIGMEPAVKPAVIQNKDKRIMLIATPVTIKEKKLKNLLNEIDKKNKVDLVALPELVTFAENEQFESQEVVDYLTKKFKDYELKNYSEIVLGCTHFKFFEPTIKRLFNEHITIIDGSKGTINQLNNILKNKNQKGNNKTKIKYYFSGKKVEDKETLNKIERLYTRLKNI